MYVVVVILCLLVTQNHVKAESEIDLKDKVTVVTGAARGIGRAIADNLLKEEVEVVIIVDKNLTQGLVTETEFKSKYGEEKVWFIHGDVTTDLDWVFEIIFEKYEYVHILVNNAGIIKESDPELILMTNMVAPALWSQKFYDVMRKDKGGKGGIILNIASIEAYVKDPFFRAYKTSKYGVLGLSVGLGHEWNYMTSEVKVIPLCPGLTDTDMAREELNSGEPSEWEIIAKYVDTMTMQSADVVGQAAVTLCKTGKTGTAYTIEADKLTVSPYIYNVTAEFLLSL
ncbi:15-hydroxyprostaglandin dehydrogenase [NAD(+)] [Manduca sexta]|nr:15-hydroxyprostaglandin dehydrogenase [NAD(+)] [Manduca sexta]